MKDNEMKRTPSKRSRGRPKGTGKGRQLLGTEMIVTETAHGDDPKLVVSAPKKTDFEKVAPDPVDEFSSHKFPPPRKNPDFRKIWGQFINNVIARQNFSLGHLHSLEILCDLLVEYEELQVFIRENGRTYQSFGRSGMSWKFYPEVSQLKSVQHHVNVYMKQLGLVLKPDEFTVPGEDDEDWT